MSDTRRLACPGPEVPGVPPWTLEIPRDWWVTETPDALLVAGPHVPAEAEFRPNITVSANRVDAEVDPDLLADRVIQAPASTLGTRTIVSRERSDHNGVVTTTVRATLDLSEPLIQVRQVLILVVLPTATPVRTMFVLTASTTAPSGDATNSALEAALGTFSLDVTAYAAR